MNDRFLHAINQQRKQLEPANPLIAGTLGIIQGGVPIVEVPNRPSYVYVQIRSSQAEVIQVFNSRVAPVYGLPVLIQWQGNRYIIFDRDSMRYSNWIDSSAYLPRHASTHEREGSAGDVVFVSQEQFLPLMPMPSGSTGNQQLVVGHYNLMTATGTFQFFPTQVTTNLTAWNPASVTGAQMVLVSLDGTNGGLVYTVGSGSTFGNWLTGTSDVLPFVPANPDISRYVPIAAVRLVNNTSIIGWDNIYDVRPIFGATRSVGGGGGGGGGGGSSTSGVAVLNNGILETYANQLNLLGSSFTLSHSGTEAELTVLGGGAGGSGFLQLDTLNGPLFGPLVVYQKNPNTANQYGDYSSIVGYLSGTTTSHQGAAVEAVNWSTGSKSYGVYVDDEGSNLAMFVQGQGRMDNPLVGFSHNIDSNRNGGTYLSNLLEIYRFGGGSPNKVQYRGAAIYINEADGNHTAGGPSFEIDTDFGTPTYIWPTNSGTMLHPSAGDWLPGSAPYYFSTYAAIPTGAPLLVVANNASAKFWITNSGQVVSRGGYNTEYGTYDINGVPHTHPEITGGGGSFNGPFPQPVFGFYGEKAGVPLGSGSILNVRGQNFDFTLSGTTFDLFLTGTAGGGGGGGVDQIGVYGEAAGVPLGTGTIFNVRGPNAVFTISGTTLDLFVTGSVGTQGPAGAFGVFGENQGVPLGTGTILNFRGSNVTASISGTVIDVFVTGAAPCNSTYMLAGIPAALASPTGTDWVVPGNVYASGSLAVFYNGSILIKGNQYEELIYPSGTYHLLFTPTTGATHMVTFGVPCVAQSYSTGSTPPPSVGIADSNGTLIVDSNGTQIVDSNGN